MTLVQITDLHLRAGHDGHGPAGRLRRVVRQVAALQPRPVAVLLSGDLADDPSDSAYEQVHELLAPLGVPIHAIPGNHDGRALLRAHFSPGDASTQPSAGAGPHLRACAHHDDHILCGRPLLICPSTNSAIRLDMRPLERVPFSVSHALGFAVHALVDGRVVSHVQPVDPSSWQ